MDQRLAKAITTPKIQSHAGELVRLALAALDALKRLDESLYERFVASRNEPNSPATGEAGLRKLWEDTFGGLLALLAYCRALESELPKKPRATTLVEDPFELGDLEAMASAPTQATDELDFAASDLGDLLEGIDEHHNEGDGEKWQKVVEKVLSIEYGLRTQYTDAQQRMNTALEHAQINQVLGLLDDTQSAASEGVHALVSAVYEAFVPDANPATVVPGYLTSLGRALLVRRGLAELAATLGPHNDVLQSNQTERHPEALQLIRDALRGFVTSVVCRAMRAADRWQMVEFDLELSTQPPSVARLTCEGLVKYLESLGSINQREVLVLHDQRTLEQMREALANARQLLDISPRTAIEMLDRAYQAAQRLRGRHPHTDALVIGLERYAPDSSAPAESTQFLERLEELLAAAGG
ncbi:MAG: hypothetical protein SFX73_37170 [Kofleriaceae bacterium]|nr:hypothetical protein [Kofleriaceae bacterium]